MRESDVESECVAPSLPPSLCPSLPTHRQTQIHARYILPRLSRTISSPALSLSVLVYLINHANVWREAAVHTEDLPVNEGGNREEIKHLGAVAPCVCVAIFGQALIWSQTQAEHVSVDAGKKKKNNTKAKANRKLHLPHFTACDLCIP